MIDRGWESQFSEAECAMFIATLYYSGLVRDGHAAAAQEIAQLMPNAAKADFDAGKVPFWG